MFFDGIFVIVIVGRNVPLIVHQDMPPKMHRVR